eukprot:4567091-Pyramimonas_sp.AAC.1
MRRSTRRRMRRRGRRIRRGGVWGEGWKMMGMRWARGRSPRRRMSGATDDGEIAVVIGSLLLPPSTFSPPSSSPSPSPLPLPSGVYSRPMLSSLCPCLLF